MKIGFIGLGKMGSRMVLKLLKEGHEVVVWNRSKAPIRELQFKTQNLKVSETVGHLVRSLEKPRVIWIMVPAGLATQSIIDQLDQFIEQGDIVIDGANSYFRDTEKRYEILKKKGIRFLGIGVSGGIIAEKNGYPLMAGGDKSAYEQIKPVLDSLVKPNGGYDYFGTGGAGHFVKMVHNGIEYGMMQSLGEGFAILRKSDYNFDLSKVAKVWQNGSIISGFLINKSAEILNKDQTLLEFSGIIPRGGEGDWTVNEAKRLKTDISVIEESVNFRKRSETNKAIQNSFTAKMINGLRNAFGGHKTARSVV